VAEFKGTNRETIIFQHHKQIIEVVQERFGKLNEQFNKDEIKDLLENYIFVLDNGIVALVAKTNELENDSRRIKFSDPEQVNKEILDKWKNP
jgi:hypothetical protein